MSEPEPPPVRRSPGVLMLIAEWTYWLMIIELLLLLALSPAIALSLLLAQNATTPLWIAVAALPVLPALAAALRAWRARHVDPDPTPARHFARGYLSCARETMSIGLLLVPMLGVLGVNLQAVSGPSVLQVLYALLLVIVLLAGLRATSITSSFSFRFRDLLRLTAFTLTTMPLGTLRLLSLGALLIGTVVAVNGFAALLGASLWTLAMWHSERSVLTVVHDRFVDPVAVSDDVVEARRALMP